MPISQAPGADHALRRQERQHQLQCPACEPRGLGTRNCVVWRLCALRCLYRRLCPSSSPSTRWSYLRRRAHQHATCADGCALPQIKPVRRPSTRRRPDLDRIAKVRGRRGIKPKPAGSWRAGARPPAAAPARSLILAFPRRLRQQRARGAALKEGARRAADAQTCYTARSTRPSLALPSWSHLGN